MNIQCQGPRRAAARFLLPALTLLAVGLIAGSTSANPPPPGTIVAKKFYDANANGVRDVGEPWLPGWRMTLTRPSGATSTKNTNANGAATWGGLPPGTGYSVLEATPLESNWVQSAPVDANGDPVNPITGITVVTCKTTTVKFGNYCKKTSGGRTPGYWSNRNGQTRMSDEGSLMPELNLLSTLNLVDATGAAFDPLNYASFRTWLLDGTATNMAYMLSVHLAAMTLNVEAGLVNGDATFLPCDCTINELLDDADASLGLYPYTPSGHPQRANQQMLKNWLDRLNNNGTIVSPRPCKYTFYTPTP